MKPHRNWSLPGVNANRWFAVAGWFSLAALTGFVIGYVHHRWFYPLKFHGDAASMHVLAKAILEERSLLPRDFSYGNQLIFLRSGPFIALASVLGARGYQAFALGSSLGVAFWFAILHWFLAAHFRSNKRALLVAVLLMIPLGVWDVDYVLGQQSHLSNVVLAAGIVVSVHLFISERSWPFLIAGCACVFAMCAESPIRGLLVLAPLILVVALVSSLKDLVTVSACALGTFVLAYVANRLLLATHPIALNHFDALSFASSTAFLGNFVVTMDEAVGSISSMNAVAGLPLGALRLLVYGSGVLFVVASFAFILAGLARGTRQGLDRLANPRQWQWQWPPGDRGREFVSLTAVFGILVGAFAVSALNPDSSRHYLWAFVLVKLCLIVGLCDAASRFVSNRTAGLSAVVASLLLSSWFASLIVHNWNTAEPSRGRNYPEAIPAINALVQSTGIRHIFGEDFWRMMPLNTLVPDVNAQALELRGGELQPRSPLTRPSWSCVEGKVLYYLRSGPVDKAIESKLSVSGGAKVHEGNGFALWTGLPVWRTPAGTCRP